MNKDGTPDERDLEELQQMIDDVDESAPAEPFADDTDVVTPHINENAGRMFLDIQRELTTNPGFIDKVTRVYQDMVLADKSGERDAFREHMTELLRLCDYNATLLAPIFFPSFTEDGPMTFWERPHAMAMMSLVPTGTMTIQASRQIGKCLSGSTLCKCKVHGEEKKLTLKELFEKAKEAA